MKKLMLSAFFAAGLVIAGLVPQSAQAAAADPVKVTGVVTYRARPLVGIEVMVECFKTGFQQRTTTDGNGVYLVTATQTQCPLGSELKVRAETANNTHGYVGAKYGTVSLLNNVNIKTVTKCVVPEYGWLGGALAGGVGVGAVAFIRRRYHLQLNGL